MRWLNLCAGQAAAVMNLIMSLSRRSWLIAAIRTIHSTPVKAQGYVLFGLLNLFVFYLQANWFACRFMYPYVVVSRSGRRHR